MIRITPKKQEALNSVSGDRIAVWSLVKPAKVQHLVKEATTSEPAPPLRAVDTQELKTQSREQCSTKKKTAARKKNRDRKLNKDLETKS